MSRPRWFTRFASVWSVWRRASAWVAFWVVLAASVALLLIAAGEIYDFHDSAQAARLPDVDAVVCLAGGRGRISAAADLWLRYRERRGEQALTHLPVLYLAGVGHQATPQTVGRLMRPGVVELFRGDELQLETVSNNTEENAEHLVANARKHQWHHILLVTSRYHIKRSYWILQRTLSARGVALAVDTFSVIQEPFEPEEWRESVTGIRVSLLEYFKWLYYRSFWTPADSR